MSNRLVVSPRLAALYFGVQSASVALWWAVLAVRPETRSFFSSPRAPETTLLAFAPADVAILVVGSAAVALAGSQGRAWRGPLAWFVAGATVYGAIYTLTLAINGAIGPLGAALMTPAAAASVMCALALTREP
jgi:hypothetical protein